MKMSASKVEEQESFPQRGHHPHRIAVYSTSARKELSTQHRISSEQNRTSSKNCKMNSTFFSSVSSVFVCVDSLDVLCHNWQSVSLHLGPHCVLLSHYVRICGVRGDRGSQVRGVLCGNRGNGQLA